MQDIINSNLAELKEALTHQMEWVDATEAQITKHRLATIEQQLSHLAQRIEVLTQQIATEE